MVSRNMLLLAALAGLPGCTNRTDGNAAAGNSGQAEAARPAVTDGTLADALAKPEAARFATLVKAAGMDKVLAGPGPYTVLVPSDAALASTPPGTDEAAAVRLIGTHVLPGTILLDDIRKAITAHAGKAMLKTMSGTTLTATQEGDALRLTDPTGGQARLASSESVYRNGVALPIDALLKPKR